MANRTPLSKKIRFEVFKRDKFTCQYCGRSMPEVTLEVDHIKPVAKGGTNDIMNLITACRDCNRGKSATELSDDLVISRQKKQLEEIAERREQIEMMAMWREELRDEFRMSIDVVVSEFEYATNRTVTETGRKHIRKWLNEFSVQEILDAVEVATGYYKPEDAFDKIPGICFLTRKREVDKDNRYYYANYLVKVIKKTIAYSDSAKVRKFAFECLHSDDDFERAKLCLDARNWTQFKENVAEEFDYYI